VQWKGSKDMTKKQRMMAAVSGQQPDELPYALWSHLPGIDLDPQLLAQETYSFFKTYDIDFIKTMNNGMYAIEDFGCEIDYSEIASGGVAKVVHTPIVSPEAWDTIKPCSIYEGALARELESLKLLLDLVKDDDVPVLFTVFSPVTTAEKLSCKQLLNHIAQGHGDKIHRALDAIAETTANLAREAIRLGADGVFFASQLSAYTAVSDTFYLEYGKPYDLKALQAADKGWLNTFHAHGNDIMFEVLRDYPVSVFNWHVWETLPALDEGQRLTGKCIMGGLQRYDITNRNKNAVRNQIYQCLQLLKGRNHILTPGCVIRYPLDQEMLTYVKNTKEYVEARWKGQS